MLKKLRLQNNLTQKECANFLGVPLRTYQSYENDVNKSQSIKYQYMEMKLKSLSQIDEEHGILTIDNIKDICGEILSKYDIKYCYLFGSYAKGTATPNSDVDLLLYTTVTGMQFFELVEELREGLSKKVDVLNQGQIKDNFELTNEILKDGIKIYG